MIQDLYFQARHYEILLTLISGKSSEETKNIIENYKEKIKGFINYSASSNEEQELNETIARTINHLNNLQNSNNQTFIRQNISAIVLEKHDDFISKSDIDPNSETAFTNFVQERIKNLLDYSNGNSLNQEQTVDFVIRAKTETDELIKRIDSMPNINNKAIIYSYYQSYLLELIRTINEPNTKNAFDRLFDIASSTYLERNI